MAPGYLQQTGPPRFLSLQRRASLNITKFQNNCKIPLRPCPHLLFINYILLGTWPGIWKMNNEFLLDEEFIQLTKKSINKIKQTYASTPYHPDFVNATNKNLDLMISPSMFWETALVTLRGIIINFARIKKRNKNRAIKTLEARIRELDDKVCCGEANIQDFNQLTNLNNDLVNLHKSELQGAYIRSRAESLEFGEKPSKFFLNFESRNRVNKTITEIKIEENNTITAHKHILDSLKNFYETLYKVQDLPKPENVNVPIPTQLTDQEKHN